MKQIQFIIAMLLILFLSKPVFADTCVKTDEYGNKIFYFCEPVNNFNSNQFESDYNQQIQMERDARKSEWQQIEYENKIRKMENDRRREEHRAKQQEFIRNIGKKSW